MLKYREYPVRCPNCNEQLACYSNEYENMVNNDISKEDALNNLNIRNYCSRIAMLNPNIITYDMENRKVIEGIKNVDQVDGPDNISERANLVFKSCVNNKFSDEDLKSMISNTNFIREQSEGIADDKRADLPDLDQQLKDYEVDKYVEEEKPKKGIQFKRRERKSKLGKVSKKEESKIKHILPPPMIEENIGNIIDLEEIKDEEEDESFKFPTEVGIPEINSDPSIQEIEIYVGADRYANILTGRTYLAR